MRRSWRCYRISHMGWSNISRDQLVLDWYIHFSRQSSCVVCIRKLSIYLRLIHKILVVHWVSALIWWVCLFKHLCRIVRPVVLRETRAGLVFVRQIRTKPFSFIYYLVFAVRCWSWMSRNNLRLNVIIQRIILFFQLLVLLLRNWTHTLFPGLVQIWSRLLFPFWRCWS